jgi:transposase
MPACQGENIAMAFSNDSRKHTVDACKKEGLSEAEIIRRFQTSRAGLDYLINHVKETKSIKWDRMAEEDHQSLAVC